MIEIIVLILISYLIITWISHYDSMFMGSIVPEWLCIFCLYDTINKRRKICQRTSKS